MITFTVRKERVLSLVEYFKYSLHSEFKRHSRHVLAVSPRELINLQ